MMQIIKPIWFSYLLSHAFPMPLNEKCYNELEACETFVLAINIYNKDPLYTQEN